MSYFNNNKPAAACTDPQAILLIMNYTDGSVHFFTYTLTLIEGTIFALCIPLMESGSINNSNNCSIQYTKDSSFSNLSSPVIGPFNIPFAIPIKETTLYAQATVVVNTSLVISVRSSNAFEFTNGNGSKSSDCECTSAANTPFSTPMTVPINPGTVTFEVYQVVMLFLFLGILLLALMISIGIIVCLVHKLSKHTTIMHISISQQS